MIERCLVCNNQVQQPVASYEGSPISQIARLNEKATFEHFAPFRLVLPVDCGHLYNLDYQEELADRMYGREFLSDVPVHLSMSQAPERVADWINLEQHVGNRVMEVGGGSRHLSRSVSQKAHSVVVFEPSRGVRDNMMTRV